MFRPAGAAVTREQAWMAAVLAAAPGAVVSHTTAARLWDLPGFPDPDTRPTRRG
ncbi:MAG TPA: hypothetical protein VFO65_04000 [Acidimicrobiales bacterium]|nr:hypothetical protein [Acidimicrobiales bacterium]